jgi:hypothetical protein
MLGSLKKRSAESTKYGIPMISITAKAVLFLLACPIAGLTAQKDCTLKDLGDSQNRQTAQENFQCLSAKIDAAMARIDALEATVLPFKDAKGAVVAFNRDRQRGSICPKGWTYFESAGGRFIVGAGEHDNGLKVYPSYIENPTLAIGGEETHTLTLNEMPSHDHAGGNFKFLMSSDGYDTSRGRLDPTRGEPNLRHIGRIAAEGGGQPHNNLPPYIALYYCVKD